MAATTVIKKKISKTYVDPEYTKAQQSMEAAKKMKQYGKEQTIRNAIKKNIEEKLKRG